MLEKKLGKTGKWVLVGIGVALVLFFVVRGFMNKPVEAVVEERYIPVQVEVTGQKTLINTAVLSGTVTSDTEVSVVPKVPGKVMSVNVKVGDSVTKGTALFTLDPSDIQNQVDTMRASLRSAEAGLVMNKEQRASAISSLERTKLLASDKIANAKQNLENTKTLYEAGAVAKTQLDQAELGLKELESSFTAQIEQLEVQTSSSSLQLAEAQFNQAQVGYNQALDGLKNATVTAPVAGIVSQVNVQVGNMATSAQSAVSLTNATSLYTTLSVAENLVNRLTKGNAVKVTVPSVSENSFDGKIDNISPSSDPRTHLYPIKITFENLGGLLKPGMFVKVELATDEKSNVIAIKSEAIVLKNQKTIVYVVVDDKATVREVVTGLDTGVEIEILEGLEPGDQVIIKGQTLVDEGHKVKVVGDEDDKLKVVGGEQS